MKELTIEQKAKAYDETICRAMIEYNHSSASKEIKDVLNYIFQNSELAESEDERIRKEILKHFVEKRDMVPTKAILDEWIAWLEKQGEQKTAKNIVETWKDMRLEVYQQASGNRHKPNCSDNTTKMFSLNDIDEIVEKMSEQSPADKVEPKPYFYCKYGGTMPLCSDCKRNHSNSSFKTEEITTWFSPQKGTKQCIDFIQQEYSVAKLTDKVEPKFKVGDWVIDKQGLVHQISNVIENVTWHTYSYDIIGGGYFNDNTESVRLWTIQDAKDGDVLVDEYNNIGIYKEIKGIYWHSYIYLGCNSCLYGFNIGGLHGKNNTKPSTKEQRDLLFQKMKEAGYEWDVEKKELKKIEQKPDEWSEEDKELLEDAIHVVKTRDNAYGQETSKTQNWLKSLRPQKQWKPSEEQLRELKNVLNLDKGS